MATRSHGELVRLDDATTAAGRMIVCVVQSELVSFFFFFATNKVCDEATVYFLSAPCEEKQFQLLWF